MRKLVLAAIAAAAAATAFPAAADPPPWAPAHGARAKQHRYVYYPTREIYFEPDAGLWFWLDGGDWQVGVNLPTIYQPFVTGGVHIELETDRPYTQHTYVVEHYGKGKSAKGNAGKGGPGGKGKDKPGKDHK